MTIAVIIQPIAAVLLEGVLLICASLTACLSPRKRHSERYTGRLRQGVRWEMNCLGGRNGLDER
jgi:hypothetical protein